MKHMINNETTSRVIHHRVVTKHSTHDTNELADSHELIEWSTQPITGDKTPQHSSELYSMCSSSAPYARRRFHATRSHAARWHATCDLTLRRLARLTRLTRINIGSARVTRTSLCATCSCWPRSGWCRWRDSNCSSRITMASKNASSPTCHARADQKNGQKEQKQGMQRSARFVVCSV